MAGMWRALMVVGVVVLVAGCGGSGSSARSSSSTTAAGGTVPRLVVQQMPGAHRDGQVDGRDVWVDDGKRMVFVDDCAAARKVTSEGGRFGPSPRAADGSFSPGYSFLCPS